MKRITEIFYNKRTNSYDIRIEEKQRYEGDLKIRVYGKAVLVSEKMLEKLDKLNIDYELIDN